MPKKKSERTTAGTKRRDFLRQSAEVAALSLFGTLGFDSVAQRVAERLKDKAGMDELAKRIVSGVGTAEASGGQDDPIANMLQAQAEGDPCPT